MGFLCININLSNWKSINVDLPCECMPSLHSSLWCSRMVPEPTALPWHIWPKKSGSQIFGGQFWIFYTFNSQGSWKWIELSKLFFNFWPKRLLNFVRKLKKWDKNWWNCVALSNLPIFCDFRLISVLSRQNLTTFLAKI